MSFLRSTILAVSFVLTLGACSTAPPEGLFLLRVTYPGVVAG